MHPEQEVTSCAAAAATGMKQQPEMKWQQVKSERTTSAGEAALDELKLR